MADFTKIYDIHDYGEPRSFIGMEITRDHIKRTIKLTQTQYITQMANLKCFGLLDCNYASTPMDPSPKLMSIDDSQQLPPDPKLYHAMVGSLMYACTIAYMRMVQFHFL